MTALRHVLPLALLATLLPLALPWLSFPFTVAISKGFAALGLALLLRAGLISIGHALFFAMGAYAAAFLIRHWRVTELFSLLALSTLIAAMSGLVIGAFMVRYRAIFFAMLNLAVSMVFFTLLSKLYYLTGGTDGLRVATPSILGFGPSRAIFDTTLLLIALTLMSAVAVLVHLYLESPLGVALSAIHTNEVRLEYLGISARAVLLVAYTASAALAGLGGAISGIAVGHIVPEFSYWTLSGQLVLIAVLGGTGGVAGAFIGAFFLELVRTFAVGFAADAWNLVIGTALLLVIFFLPEGLYGLIMTLEKRKRVWT
jgi:ABC-type branched-subunit amino acid transport system permease subunit